MIELKNIKELAPAAFRNAKDGAQNGVSKHYQFMQTSDIIEGLGRLGWNPFAAKQQKSKKNPETTKHMLRLRHSSFDSVGIKGNIPEILIINSHDRTSALHFHVGIFRLVCENGLVVADETFSKLRVRHLGTTFEDVKKIILDISENLPNVFKSIERFQGIMMSDAERYEFAMRAIAVRFPEYINEHNGRLKESMLLESVSLDEILKPNRVGDYGVDLWTTMNVVQEKIIKGGFQRIGETGKSKSVRELTNIRNNVLVNKGIWSLTEEFAS